MHALRLSGVTEDGSHLVLTDGATDYVLAIDGTLRAAMRREAPGPAHLGRRGPMTPVEVQALIRDGADAEEAAERAGWSVDKVRRYEGPILAERRHIAQIASGTRLRPRGVASGSPTLLDRVSRRLHARDVVLDDLDWDSWRGDDGEWVVVARFEEGGRQRHATWGFRKTSMSLRPLDAEAARLSDEDPDLLDPGPDADPGREREQQQHDYSGSGSGSGRGSRGPQVDEDSDLMATLRSTSRARTRKRGARRSTSAPTSAGTPEPITLPTADEDEDSSPPATDVTDTGTEGEAHDSVGTDDTAAEADAGHGEESTAAVARPAETAFPADPEAPTTGEHGDREGDTFPVDPEAPAHEEPHLPFETPVEPSDAAEPTTDVDDEAERAAEPTEEHTETPAQAPAPKPRSRRSSSGQKSASSRRAPAAKKTSPAEQPAPAPEAAEGDDQDAAPSAGKPGPPARQQNPRAQAGRQAARRRGRASVPAWDDIMFGSKPGDED